MEVCIYLLHVYLPFQEPKQILVTFISCLCATFTTAGIILNNCPIFFSLAFRCLEVSHCKVLIAKVKASRLLFRPVLYVRGIPVLAVHFLMYTELCAGIQNTIHVLPDVIKQQIGSSTSIVLGPTILCEFFYSLKRLVQSNWLFFHWKGPFKVL